MKLIVFDCDGTLVDSQHMICAAMRQAYEANNLSVPAREQVLAIVGLSLPDAFRRLAATTSREADHPVEALVTCYKSAFAELRSSVDHLEPLYPGARDAIDTLAARPDTLLGIATGKSQRGVRAVLGRHGLAERFATIQTSDDAPSKPHPGMVLAAMRETDAFVEAPLDGRPLRAPRRFGRIDRIVGEDLFQEVAHVRSTHNDVAAIGSGADLVIHNRSSAAASSEKSPSSASTPAAASASDE